jgi:hypothetical protein
MSEIQECYWLIPLLKVEYSRKGFGIITRSTIVIPSVQDWVCSVSSKWVRRDEKELQDVGKDGEMYRLGLTGAKVRQGAPNTPPSMKGASSRGR